jgi:NAD(P)-dependent dehydrogenase (short-subunit alcohol dehydrogenase family)
MDKFSLSGKTILVTGASSGIGRAIAIACAEAGACVVLSGRNVSRLEETLRMMCGVDKHCIISADLTDAAQRQVLVERVPELDGLVQCAGIGNRVPCKAIGEEDIQSVFGSNIEAPMLFQAELLQERKIKKGASIVYMASIAARSAVAGNALYSASKAAIIAYANCLALELAPRNIRVNCISPAMVWTDLALVGASREELEQDQLKYPLKRYALPEDITGAALYLLSDASSWVTGSNMELTGGTQTL